jgi:hypothetical protein
MCEVMNMRPGQRTYVEKKYSARFPEAVYERLRDFQKEKPYMSLNILIVEAVVRFLDAEEKKEAKA